MSSSDHSNSNGSSKDVGSIIYESKQDARSDRLGVGSLRKTREEQLRKNFQVIARKNCLKESEEFGKCAQKEGLMVIIRCRELSNEGNNLVYHTFCKIL